MKCLGLLIRHHSSAVHAASQHCWCAQGKSGWPQEIQTLCKARYGKSSWPDTTAAAVPMSPIGRGVSGAIIEQPLAAFSRPVKEGCSSRAARNGP